MDRESGQVNYSSITGLEPQLSGPLGRNATYEVWLYGYYSSQHVDIHAAADLLKAQGCSVSHQKREAQGLLVIFGLQDVLFGSVPSASLSAKSIVAVTANIFSFFYPLLTLESVYRILVEVIDENGQSFGLTLSGYDNERRKQTLRENPSPDQPSAFTEDFLYHLQDNFALSSQDAEGLGLVIIALGYTDAELKNLIDTCYEISQSSNQPFLMVFLRTLSEKLPKKKKLFLRILNKLV